jgi:hypothetical protein
MTIVTTHYRYKRPPPKRKPAVPLTGPRIPRSASTLRQPQRCRHRAFLRIP